MKFGNNSSATVENNSENQGMMTGKNYGCMIQNNYGLSYKDVIDICHAIMHDDLAKYCDEALTVALLRKNEFIEMLVQKLKDRLISDAQALAEFKEPAMQFDYFEAQKAYMKTGTPELAEMLSNLLVERISESSRSLLQIALSEAIVVTPKLLPSHMATLALLFIIKQTIALSINSHELFSVHLREIVLPIFDSGVSSKELDFQHLSFTGCCQPLPFTENKLITLLKSSYNGLFMKGFDKEEIPKATCGQYLYEVYPLFKPCLNDQSKLQIDAMNNETLSKKIQENSIPSKDAEVLKKLFKKNTLSDNDAQALVEKIVPEMIDLFEYWDECAIKYCILSTVGIVIGAEYANQITNQCIELKI